MKAVVTDKSVFPALPKLFRKKNDGKEGDEQGATIQSDRDYNAAEIMNQKKTKMPPYNDTFREANMQKVRHLFQKTNIIQSMQWQADLRHWHPDRIDKKDE